MEYAEIVFTEIEENDKIIELIQNVVKECFKTEKLEKTNMYLNIILTNPENIRKINKKYRNIDKETDVLSFPMFEKNEIVEIVDKKMKMQIREVLGDIIISIPKVEDQAKEYGHSFERELAYMVVLSSLANGSPTRE